MPENSLIAMPYEDYAQSANTLFHFMKKEEFLDFSLTKQALVPRYCVETIDYLNVRTESGNFPQIAVLQKCFCDIPLHKLMTNFALCGTGPEYESLSDREKRDLEKQNTHPDYYGCFAIAFSKPWGEEKGLQPIHYLNERSHFAIEFSSLLNATLAADDIPDNYSEDILGRLAFLKPLRGNMNRTVLRDDSSSIIVTFNKNFHDECEWRYVPSLELQTATKLSGVIANPTIVDNSTLLNEINARLESEKFECLWLKFNYNDIRYVIVPDVNARIHTIETIMKIPDQQFDPNIDTLLQKHILISKIFVLDELGKDL